MIRPEHARNPRPGIDRISRNVRPFKRRRFINHEAVDWAHEQHPGRKLLLLLIVIAEHANADWQCWPSQATLARLTDQCERTVRTHMALLEAAGLISVGFRYDDRGRRTSSLITLTRAEEADETRLTPPGQTETPTGKNVIAYRQLAAGIEEQTEKTQRTAAREGRNEQRSEIDSALPSKPVDQRAIQGEGAGQSSPTSTPLTPAAIAEKFDDFWNAYPKRGGHNPRDPAEKEFAQAVKGGVDPKLIVEAVRQFAVAEKKSIGTRFIPQARNWLRDARWTANAANIVAFAPRPLIPTVEEINALADLMRADDRLEQPARDLIRALVSGVAQSRRKAGKEAQFSWCIPGTRDQYLQARFRVDAFNEFNFVQAWQSLQDVGVIVCDHAGRDKILPPQNWRDVVAAREQRRQQAIAESGKFF